MSQLPKEIRQVSELYGSLPGIGPKLSHRLGLYSAVRGKDTAKRLAGAIEKLVENISECSQCANVAVHEFCNICDDSQRDQSIILVVEDALDLYNIEETGEYNGLYHVLQGIISPINGVSPAELTIDQLLKRVKSNSLNEVIFALNPTVEGDSTVLYLQEQIKSINNSLTITRLAKGIPSGSDLEFVSSQTLSDSLKRRDVV